MRLIDADKFEQQVATVTIAYGLSVKKCNDMLKLIDKQPTVGEGDITTEMAVYAYNVLRQNCKQHKDCSRCAIQVDGDCSTFSTDIPEYWPDLEAPDGRE